MKPSLTIITHIKVLCTRVRDRIVAFCVGPLSAYYSRSYPPWLVLFFLTLTTSGQTSHGTASFIIRTPNEIVAATDSKLIHGDGSVDPNPICKIRQFGKVFVAVNGMARSPSVGYDVFSILAKVSSEGGTLDEEILAFDIATKSQLEKTLRWMKVNEPSLYQKAMRDKSLAGANFFGVARGNLFFYNRRFLMRAPFSDNVVVDVERHQCPGLDCADGFAYVYVGPPEYNQRLQLEFPVFSKAPNLVDVARRFVQMQIDDSLPDVGPPIDILRITTKGAQWIQRKPECEQKKTPPPPTKPTPTKRGRRRPAK